MRNRLPRFPLVSLAASLLWACGDGSAVVAGGSGTDAGNALTVLALDPTGTPAARARVEAWPEDFLSTTELSRPVASDSTGDDGTTRLSLPAGRWSIVVRKGGRSWRRVVAVGDTVRDTLRPMASIEGTVLGGGGLLVSVRGLGIRALCDPSGRFMLDSLPSGRIVLVVRSPMGDVSRTFDLAPSETRPAFLPSDTLALDPRDTLETPSAGSTAPVVLATGRLGDSGPFATAARLSRASITDTARLFEWNATGDEGLRLAWRGLDTLRLELPGRSPIEVAGIPLDAGSHLVGLDWISGTLGIWLDSGLVVSLTTQSLIAREGWSPTPSWGSRGVAEIDGVLAKTEDIPSDWFIQVSQRR